MSIAYPFIDVTIDTKGLQPVAQRAPGVLAVVGASNKGSAAANVPVAVGSIAEAAAAFADVGPTGAVTTSTALFVGLKAALLQSPRPSKIYGVKLDGSDFAAALGALLAADDVTFVAVAGQYAKKPGAGETAADKNPAIKALKDHVEGASADGAKRIGVFAIDPALAKSATYADDVAASVDGLKSSVSRLVCVAARGADDAGETPDVGCAAASAIAGQPVAASIVLKKVAGFSLPLAQQFGPTEIKALSEAQVIPIIDPTLIPGESLHFAEGCAFTSDASLKYIDVVRLLDDVEYRLKAGLIGMIGDARITRAGLNGVVNRAQGILDRLIGPGGIDGYSVLIPVLEILRVPEASRSAGEAQAVAEARAERVVEMLVSITLGPAVHLLNIALQPRF